VFFTTVFNDALHIKVTLHRNKLLINNIISCTCNQQTEVAVNAATNKYQ